MAVTFLVRFIRMERVGPMDICPTRAWSMCSSGKERRIGHPWCSWIPKGGERKAMRSSQQYKTPQEKRD